MNVTYRKADAGDIELLVKLRLIFLEEDCGEAFEHVRAGITEQLKEYFLAHIGRDCICFLAESHGEVVAAAFLTISERPAGINFPTGRVGRISNVYTFPEHRGKGVATGLVKHLIDAAATMNLSFIELSATESGKPLYEKLGFAVKQSKYTAMRLDLPLADN